MILFRFPVSDPHTHPPRRNCTLVMELDKNSISEGTEIPAVRAVFILLDFDLLLLVLVRLLKLVRV